MAATDLAAGSLSLDALAATEAEGEAGGRPAEGLPPAIDGAPWPGRPAARRIVLLLMAANFMAYIDRSILSLLVEPIKHSLRLTDTQIGLLQGVPFGIFFTLIIFPAGWVADRGNRLRLVGIGVAAWGLMTALCGFCANFAQLFLARMGVAAGEATLTPTGPSLIADTFPSERRTLPMALYSLGAAAGAGVALIVGGIVASIISNSRPIAVPGLGAMEAWQVIFVVVGLPGVALSALVFRTREPVRRDLGQASGTWAELAAAIGKRRAIIAPHFAGICLYQTYAYAFLAWLPAFFMRVHGWSIADVGLRYGPVHLACGVLGGLGGSVLARRFWRGGRHNANLLTGAICLGAMLIPAVAGTLTANPVLSVGLLASSMALAQAASGPSIAAIQEIVPNRLRGRTTALYYALTATVSVTLGPLIVGVMSDRLFPAAADFGKALSLTALACLPLACGLMALAARARLRLAE